MIDGQMTSVLEMQAMSLPKSGIFYEVIRVMEGVYLFAEDHIRRLERSIQTTGFDYVIDFKLFYNSLLNFKMNVSLHNGNIKVLMVFNPGGSTFRVIVYQISHYYPSEKEYTDGVAVSLIRLERPFPSVKQFNADLQQACKEVLRSKSVFEVLLVDHENHITEGSKSNLFFIRSDTVYTAPAETVLQGITRNKVIEIIKSLNYKVIECNISINTINTFQAAFLTGTSPKVMPIASIDEIRFDPAHVLLRMIMSNYHNLIINYIKNISYSAGNSN